MIPFLLRSSTATYHSIPGKNVLLSRCLCSPKPPHLKSGRVMESYWPDAAVSGQVCGLRLLLPSGPGLCGAGFWHGNPESPCLCLSRPGRPLPKGRVTCCVLEDADGLPVIFPAMPAYRSKSRTGDDFLPLLKRPGRKSALRKELALRDPTPGTQAGQPAPMKRGRMSGKALFPFCHSAVHLTEIFRHAFRDFTPGAMKGKLFRTGHCCLAPPLQAFRLPDAVEKQKTPCPLPATYPAIGEPMPSALQRSYGFFLFRRYGDRFDHVLCG